MSTILDKIAADKRIELDGLKKSHPIERLEKEMPQLESNRFSDALSDPSGIHIIAEIKKASPSRGVLIEDFDAETLAVKYANGGAAALSVLTESKYFQGSFEYLKIASHTSGLPVLCKDFILEPYQICHARYHGADAVLLIVALLEKEMLVECLDTANDLGLDCLVEVHDEKELRIAIEVGASIIGVNNRDLRNFNVKLETSEHLSSSIPQGIIRVSESGIFTRADIDRLLDCGFSNFLIGEALVKAQDPELLLRELRGS